MFTKQHLAITLFTALCALAACKKNIEEMPAPQAALAKNKKDDPKPKGTMFYALTNNNQLVQYASGNPLREMQVMDITGLVAMDEKIVGIDFRPNTGQLFGVSNESRLYVINHTTGMAAAVSTSPFGVSIKGMEVGFDFNPTVDRIRLVTGSGINLRLNPENGALAATDGNINPPGSSVTAVAYTNSFAGTTTTTLYDIDVKNDKLYIQNPPNNGTLVEVGSLGLQAVGDAGFDISPDNSVAIAAIFGRGDEDADKEESNGNKYRFYYIDLQTGKAKNAGKTNRQIIGVAIPTHPVAYATDAANRLLIFNPETGGDMLTKNITGLQPGEKLLGIDMRPATGQLYALGNTSRLYTVNITTGAATAVGGVSFTPALLGDAFGFDFNPTVDLIRVVSNAGQNLRVSPVTGSVFNADGMLNPGTPMVDAAGYTNSFFRASTTALYVIDYANDMLHLQSPPNAGTLQAGKPLGVDVSSANGFDIGGLSNKAWAIFNVGGMNGVYSIDLSSGMATKQMAFPVQANGFAIGLGF